MKLYKVFRATGIELYRANGIKLFHANGIKLFLANGIINERKRYDSGKPNLIKTDFSKLAFSGVSRRGF